MRELIHRLESRYAWSSLEDPNGHTWRWLDTAGHGPAVQAVEWQSRPALQLSRRSNGWNPSRDTAGLKAAKVLSWFADQ